MTHKAYGIVLTKVALTHWGRVTHICISKLSIIGSDNGLSPGRCKAITWTNAGILLIGSLGTKLNEILIEINKFSFKKIHFKQSFGKWQPFCLRLDVLITHATYKTTPHPSNYKRSLVSIQEKIYCTVTEPDYTNMECHPGGHYWYFYPSFLSFKSSHCKSFEDQAPLDLIYGYRSSNVFHWLYNMTKSVNKWVFQILQFFKDIAVCSSGNDHGNTPHWETMLSASKLQNFLPLSRESSISLTYGATYIHVD